MTAIIGNNTWDYCLLIERMAANYHNPRNRHQRGMLYRKVERPLAKRSLKSSKTSVAYWYKMTGWQRLVFAAYVQMFGKDAGHEYVRMLKAKHRAVSTPLNQRQRTSHNS